MTQPDISELGVVDTNTISLEVSLSSRSYTKWKNEDRYQIGRYALENGTAASVRRFKDKFPSLNESTVRSFKVKVEKELSDARKEGRDVSKSINKYSAPPGRPLLLGELDSMVQTYIRAVSTRGAVINTSLAKATANALIRRHPDIVGEIDIDSSSWAKSLFKRMGFVRRVKTSSKVNIPDSARKELEYLFHYEIATAVETQNIPYSMIINIDQTPLRYVSVGNYTLIDKGAKSVTIEGNNDKRTITGTFGISLSGNFLPIQLIYGGKTNQSLPRFKFPAEFSLSANPTHYSNAAESIKLIEEIIVPYLENERKIHKLQPTQKGLLIMDVFTGQMTSSVHEVLDKNNICVVNVPANMTHLYQPLDLTVNGYAKKFLKNKFNNWYANQISKQLDAGTKLDEIRIKLKLSLLKPLHAAWIVDFYNEMTSVKGKEIIASGWRSAGITDAIRLGTKELPPIDPFHDIDPLVFGGEKSNQLQSICNLSLEEKKIGYSRTETSESDSEDEFELHNRGAFDAFADFNKE